MDPKTIDFFVHIPKSAGTSMNGIIRSQYPPGTVLSIGHSTVDERARTFRELSPAVRIIVGHLPLGTRQQMQRPCRAFTILREPVARVLSLYAYIGREKKHRWHEQYQSGELSLQECARRQRNQQVRYLCGVEISPEMRGEELLSMAKHELERGLAAFGLAERFAETVLYFNHALGWNVRSYVSANVAGPRTARPEISPGDLDEIRACNTLDIELYEFARELFARRIEAAIPNLEQELPALKRRVAAAERWSRWTALFRRWQKSVA